MRRLPPTTRPESSSASFKSRYLPRTLRPGFGLLLRSDLGMRDAELHLWTHEHTSGSAAPDSARTVIVAGAFIYSCLYISEQIMGECYSLLFLHATVPGCYSLPSAAPGRKTLWTDRVRADSSVIS